MRKILVGALLLGVIVSCAQSTGYQISGSVNNAKTGDMIFVNLHTNDQDTVVITNGKFNLKGETEEPTPFLIFSADVLPAQTLFYVHKGTTRIEFTANEPATMKIQGGKTQKEYQEYSALTKPLLAQFDSVQMLAMGGKLDQTEVQRVAMEIQQNYEKVNMDFVNDHPKSYVSALLAYEYFRQKTQLTSKEKKEYLAQLDKKVQESHFGKKMNEMVNAGESTAVGKTAPDFTLPNVDGKNISLSSLRGKYVLIDFWAGWCQPCRKENPNVVAAYNKFKSKNFTVIGVSLDENKKQWLEAIKKDKLKWQHVSDLSGWNSSAVSLYNIKSLPSNLLIDPQGNILAKDLRGVDLENELSKLLK